MDILPENDPFCFALKEMVNCLGTDIFEQSEFPAYLADWMAGKHKNETRLLKQIIKAGYHQSIIKTNIAVETAIFLDRKLRDEHFISLDVRRRMICILFYIIKNQELNFTEIETAIWNNHYEVESAVRHCERCKISIHPIQRYCSFCGQQLPLNISFGEETLDIFPNAFKNHIIHKLKLSNSIHCIGKFAFSGCNIPGTLEIPEATEVIEDDAFGNNRINQIIFHGITSIGHRAFKYNIIQNLTINGIITNIGDEAFYGDSYFFKNNISNLAIPEGCVNIGSRAFTENGIKTFSLPNSITTIGEETFLKNKIEKLVLPGSLTKIGEAAFAYNQIKKLEIYSNIKVIPKKCFYNNAIEKMAIHSCVELIEKEAFFGTKLRKIKLPDNIIINDKRLDFSDVEYAEIGKNVILPHVCGRVKGQKYLQDIYIKKGRKACIITKQQKQNNTTWHYQTL